VNDILQGKFSADSTKRGIAITYAMKSFRLGIRFVDAFSSDLESKVENQIKLYKPMINALSNEEKEKISKVLEERYHERAAAIIESGTSFDAKNIAGKLLEDVQPFKGIINDVMPVLRKDYLADKLWVLEGAQGMGLDVDEGIYPYTTSSNMIPGAVTHGLGIPHYYIDRVVSVVKVLTSRVGSGVQPCEIEGQLATDLREKGGEYGTTTGRGRRMLWLTMPELRKAVHLSGTTDLALTKLDVLSHLSTVKDGKLKINNHYELGELLCEFGIPASMEDFANCKPVYREFESWPELSKKEWLQIPEDGQEAVPKEMRPYIGYIAKELVPFGRNLDKGNFYLSFGPEREATLEIPTAEVLEWA
jgi:adenylosuccinate synthase